MTLKGRLVWIGLTILLGFACPIYGQGQSKDALAPVSLDVTEAYLEDVLKLLSQQSSLNFVAAEEVRDKKVTMYLDHVPIQEALETILQAYRLVLKPSDQKNLYLVTESNAPKVPTVTKVFHLKYARVVPTAGEILPTFGLSGSLITTAFSTTGTGGTSGSAGTGTGTGTGGTSGIGIGGGIGGVLGGAGATGTSGMLGIIRSLLTEYGSVVSDHRTNSLIVTDIPERIPVIEETITQLDVKPIQIFIEAEILEVTLDTLRRLGVEYSDSIGQVASYVGPKRTSYFPFVRGLLDTGTKSHTMGTLSLADTTILFKLLATEKDVKFLARPRLLTLSNEVAEIRIIADAVTGVTSTSQATTGTVTETVERNTVGTILRVTPIVNEEKYITMVIEPEVSRVIQSISFTKFLDPNRRAARTTVMVPDGGTVMIAGLISTENTDSNRRIPGLGDIPLLGLPFKRSESEHKNTEIILFITPHILTQEQKMVVVAQEREQTPLTTQEQRILETHHRRLMKGRAIAETIDNILR